MIDPIKNNLSQSKHHTEETHLDVAKDKGLQNSPYFLQGDEDSIYSHDGKGSGSAFQNHEKRRPDFEKYSCLLKIKPLFVKLSSQSEDDIDDDIPPYPPPLVTL